jgi:DNA modification methylase
MTIHTGDCIEVMAGMDADSVDAIVTDPPYSIAFMGKRAPSDMAHLVVLCEWHHLQSGWATAHRPELRAYLKGLA